MTKENSFKTVDYIYIILAISTIVFFAFMAIRSSYAIKAADGSGKINSR
ncbi:hypothetical protein MTO98_17370 [Mucilaginibacter sp. SMC90]|nr:hypothetical protein [Mucilaginibacter sp. SMC90]UOE52841.1 hypothetical protein MTO98_17370 [Mucilaginibacter sp. SMC90]